ncbi:MAG: hypothetical protein Q9211_004741 [Gyalolechia sp. 1 TL-2023]
MAQKSSATPLLKAQHFIDASKWEKGLGTGKSSDGIKKKSVPYQRYTDDTKTAIAVKGHAHGTNQHWYRKVDVMWKFAGLAPEIKWGECDFDRVFAHGRDKYSKEEQARVEMRVLEGVSRKTVTELSRATMGTRAYQQTPMH